MIQPSLDSSSMKMPCVEIISDQMAELLSRMSTEKKLECIDGMWRFARKMTYSAVKHQYPEWSESQIADEVKARIRSGSK